MATSKRIEQLKQRIDQLVIQRDHWKQLAENRNSIVVTEVCPESRSVEEYIIDADSVRASWRLIRGYREQSEALRAENERLADALDRQSVITGDYIARCQRLADELAITRRVIDRIDQLCTTPHESKERFIRRAQSVIEWERAAQQEQPQ